MLWWAQCGEICQIYAVVHCKAQANMIISKWCNWWDWTTHAYTSRIQPNAINSRSIRSNWLKVSPVLHTFRRHKNLLNSNACCCAPLSSSSVQGKMPTDQWEFFGSKHQWARMSWLVLHHQNTLKYACGQVTSARLSYFHTFNSRSMLKNTSFEKNRIGNNQRHKRLITPVNQNK